MALEVCSEHRQSNFWCHEMLIRDESTQSSLEESPKEPLDPWIKIIYGNQGDPISRMVSILLISSMLISVFADSSIFTDEILHRWCCIIHRGNSRIFIDDFTDFWHDGRMPDDYWLWFICIFSTLFDNYFDNQNFVTIIRPEKENESSRMNGSMTSKERVINRIFHQTFYQGGNGGFCGFQILQVQIKSFKSPRSLKSN